MPNVKWTVSREAGKADAINHPADRKVPIATVILNPNCLQHILEMGPTMKCCRHSSNLLIKSVKL